jgi:hypothetical protein
LAECKEQDKRAQQEIKELQRTNKSDDRYNWAMQQVAKLKQELFEKVLPYQFLTLIIQNWQLNHASFRIKTQRHLETNHM